MAPDFEGPVNVTTDGRRTVVDGNYLLVGRSFEGDGAVGPVEDQVIAPTDGPVGPFTHLVVGDEGSSGAVTIVDREDHATISLTSGFGTFGTGRQAGGVMVRGANNGPIIEMTGSDGRITFRDSRLRTTLTVDGIAGDITFSGADCAEEFEVEDAPEPGSVLCIDDRGVLVPCSRAYDNRVAGVVSGAGEWRAALRLGCQSTPRITAPIALVGRVACLVEAETEPIGVGHLLTTSTVPGHARRASDAARSFGSILGKSLGSLQEGRGLVTILVSLQ